jgi:hypothetical protein
MPSDAPPSPPAGTGREISMKDLDDRIQRPEKEVEDLKKRPSKLEKKLRDQN